ncbi:hypothetical protein [Xenorhabdus thuongxuanensis]|uniref:Transcriptional regulator n=1 Tax=Xenorhabdus thuongxuanensis TaxID=1873484 RepID=A0A1Q5U3U7_9GAMM|nr:hypothetical protein [Xenorhabdus thuongxuanensis]OKP07161.1 transcriptional regulator [Xenorhabdus thuongxuanensis]
MGTIGRRLINELKRLGFSEADFAELTGYSGSSHDGTSLDCLYLQVLAKYGVDTSYIVTGNRIQPIEISEDEQEIIEQYRAMNKAHRLKIQKTDNEITHERNRETVK